MIAARLNLGTIGRLTQCCCGLRPRKDAYADYSFLCHYYQPLRIDFMDVNVQWNAI